MEKRDEKLAAWLDRVDARMIWYVKKPGGGRIEKWLVGKSVVMIDYFANGHGWDIFVPSTDTNRVDIAIDEAAVKCGVEGCRGL